jgi:hypothetical protein
MNQVREKLDNFNPDSGIVWIHVHGLGNDVEGSLELGKIPLNSKDSNMDPIDLIWRSTFDGSRSMAA